MSGTCHTANWSSMLVFISIWCYHNLENEFRQLCLLLQKRPWCHRAVKEYITSFSLAQGEEGPGCYRAALILDVSISLLIFMNACKHTWKHISRLSISSEEGWRKLGEWSSQCLVPCKGVICSVTDIFQTRVLKVSYQNLCETIETNSLVHEAALLARFSREKKKR